MCIWRVCMYAALISTPFVPPRTLPLVSAKTRNGITNDGPTRGTPTNAGEKSWNRVAEGKKTTRVVGVEQRRVDRSVGLVQRTTLFDSSARSYAQPRRPPAFSNIHFLHRSVSSDASIYLFTMFDIHPATRQGQQTGSEKRRGREREREKRRSSASGGKVGQ